MKRQKLNTIVIFLALATSFCTAQNNNTAIQAENMLFEFYSKHIQVWEIPALPSDVRYEKLDSLMQIYCTSKLRNKARDVYENVGVDLLTNDLIGNSNENLKVEKDTASENCFMVSFISDVVTYSDAPNAKTNKRVVLQVKVVKIGDDLLIDNVK